MTKNIFNSIIQSTELLNNKIPLLNEDELKHFVGKFHKRKDEFTNLLRTKGSPLYVIFIDSLVEKANKFKKTFNSIIPESCIYFAMKSNHHPSIVSSLIEEGIGIDVSSGEELEKALNLGAKNIVFSGPGKQISELKMAVENSEHVTLLIDSFNELSNVNKITLELKKSIRAGVRITTDESGIWRKFGIPVNDLSNFFVKASEYQNIDLCGIQFHISWNLNYKAQVVFITRLAVELRLLDKKFQEKIKFIDIGGGFWPEEGEWLQLAATPYGTVRNGFGLDNINPLTHYKKDASKIKDFAEHISATLNKQIPDNIKYRVFLEPGRWLCNDSMHILLKVVDVKSDDLVITDGATNAIGWERFESDYFPVINLTHPSLEEKKCLIAGSLCTPHDIWGYSYFGDKIENGDILLIPNQGAYTYSLRQNFIKPLPKCVTVWKTNVVDMNNFN